MASATQAALTCDGLFSGVDEDGHEQAKGGNIGVTHVGVGRNDGVEMPPIIYAIYCYLFFLLTSNEPSRGPNATKTITYTDTLQKQRHIDK